MNQSQKKARLNLTWKCKEELSMILDETDIFCTFQILKTV